MLVMSKADHKQQLFETLSMLALVLQTKDAELYRHSRRVQTLALGMAQALALPESETASISLAAFLHDIGKVYIDDAILNKAGHLTRQEFAEIQKHPWHGAILLDEFKLLKSVAPLVYHHHERWDGDGYPERLSGQAIPLGARIITIADAFEVITTHRTYSMPRTLLSAIEELQRCAGTQFDAALVSHFCATPGVLF
jgi:putative nucleotidyltransferase with HDIG domain